MSQKTYTYEMVAQMYRQFKPDADREVQGRILVAEDNPPMRKIIAQTLQKRGYEVDEAEDGLKAVRILKESPPDLAILDVQMPKVSGFSILEAMRRDPKFRHTPVIIATARKSKEDVLTAQRLQASGYITKPFEMQTLMEKVEALLGAKPKTDAGSE
jgi:DNA-binding response OmpR family regulator